MNFTSSFQVKTQWQQWLSGFYYTFTRSQSRRHCTAVPAHLQWREVFNMLVLLTIRTLGDRQKIPDLSAALQSLIIIQRLFNISTGGLKEFLLLSGLMPYIYLVFHFWFQGFCLCYFCKTCQKKISYTKILKILTYNWPFYIVSKAKQCPKYLW